MAHNIKKRRSDDTEFRDEEIETRLANVKKALEDHETRARHNSDALKRMTNKLNDPAKRAKYNASVADKLKDPSERAKHNERQLKLVTEKRIDSTGKMKHNLAELDRYRTMRGELKSVIIKYLSDIAEGPTFVCSCCGSISGKQLSFLREKNLFQRMCANMISSDR